MYIDAVGWESGNRRDVNGERDTFWHKMALLLQEKSTPASPHAEHAC